jgi:tRNA threonylcarbamoyladenosine biosynthesis protein TsaE
MPANLLLITATDAAAGRLDLLSRHEAATFDLGRRLAWILGQLGAGKTVLVRGLAAGLGCLGAVSSPTFTLLMEHPPGENGVALFHFDAYRIPGGESFCADGLDEYFDMAGVCVVEWGSQIAEVLPGRTLLAELALPDPDQPDLRQIRLAWPACPERLEALRRDIAGSCRHRGSGRLETAPPRGAAC